MTAIVPAPAVSVIELAKRLGTAAQRTSAYATLRSITRNDVDLLLAKPAAVRATPEWSEQFRFTQRTLWRTEELLIAAIDAERAARVRLTEAQEGSLS